MFRIYPILCIKNTYLQYLYLLFHSCTKHFELYSAQDGVLPPPDPPPLSPSPPPPDPQQGRLRLRPQPQPRGRSRPLGRVRAARAQRVPLPAGGLQRVPAVPDARSGGVVRLRLRVRAVGLPMVAGVLPTTTTTTTGRLQPVFWQWSWRGFQAQACNEEQEEGRRRSFEAKGETS